MGVYRRIVVCCDGTENDSIGTDNALTNVARLARSLETQVDDRNYIQVVHYQTGIATGTWSLTNKYDAAFGRGLHTDVKRAYNFICTNWSASKDEIYLVGFSRGAYTVRCLAAFIDVVGLLTPSGLIHLNWLYNLWLDGTIRPEKLHGIIGKGSLALQHLDNIHCIRPLTTIKACVVWDTVSALGLPDSLSWLRPAGDDLAMVDNSVPKIVDKVFHALALNERRALFKPNIWSDLSNNRGNDLNIKQCWFLGAHSDIGGGYEDIGLANLSLIWMVAQLKTYTYLKISDHSLKQLLLPQDISSSGGDGGSLQITGFKSTAPTLSTQGKIANSVTSFFKALPTASRILHLNAESPETQGRVQVGTISSTASSKTQQSIHWTVRVMMADESSDWKCPMLQHCSTKLAQPSTTQDSEAKQPLVSWCRSAGSPAEEAVGFVNEDVALDEEIQLLRWWTTEVVNQEPFETHTGDLSFNSTPWVDTSSMPWGDEDPEESMAAELSQKKLARLLCAKIEEAQNPKLMYPG